MPSNVRGEAPGYGPRFAFLDARYATAEHALDVELTRGAAMVVRLVGTNEEEGRRLLADAQMITATSLADAAQKAVAAAK